MLLWWMTGIIRVGWWAVAATFVGVTCACASGTAVWTYWMYEGATVAWHTMIGLALGRFVLEETRRRVRGGCPACGYCLGGLARGAVCPECSLASTA